jgi:hypothetical protein
MERFSYIDFENEFYKMLAKSIDKYKKELKKHLRHKEYSETSEEDIIYDLDSEFDINAYTHKTTQSVIRSGEYVTFYDLLKHKDSRQFRLFDRNITMDINKQLRHVIHNAITLSVTQNFKQFMKEEFLEKLFNFIFLDEHTIVIETELHNFKCQPVILLSQQNIRIEAKNKEDFTLIVFEVKDKKDFSLSINEGKDPLKTIERAMGIIRIYLNKNIQYEITKVNYIDGCPEILVKPQLLPYYKKGEEFTLGESEMKTFIEFFTFAFTKVEDKIKRTIEIFSSSCNRISNMDKLLDMVFSWEMLLGTSESQDSITYRICLRAVKLLKSDPYDRKMLFSALSKLYAARSDLVHGNKRSSKFYKTLARVEIYQEIIRISLKEFIGLMKSCKLTYEQLIERLDYDSELKNDSNIDDKTVKQISFI